MRTHFLYVLIGLLFMCTSSQTFAQAKKPTDRGYIQPQTATQQNNSKTTNAVNYATKAEKYAADGLTAPGSKTKTKSSTSTSNTQYSGTNTSGSLNASTAERCLSEQALQERLQDPAYQTYRQNLAATVSQEGLKSVIACDAGNSIVIPVAIHFNNAYNTTDIACIEAAINAQIASLNADFAAENGDITKYTDVLESCSPNEACVASDGACITFCVADQNHPAGYGLNDGDMAYTLGVFNAGGFGAGGTGAGADWSGYLNMFIIDGLGFGVADGIPGAANGDGVSQDGSFFGGPGFTPCSSGGLLNDDGAWNLGRTMTHEVGHYLGLYHTFQDGCNDEPQSPYPVTDTPAQPGSSSGCPAVSACGTLGGCTAGESVQYNYMDYFDDACLVMFSQEQAAAMNTFSNSTTWAANKVSCTLPTYNPIIACSFRAAFDPADGTAFNICTDNGTAIQFADASSSTAISWDWTFAVAGDATIDVATANTQNPVINVTSGDGTSGTLTVELTSCDATGTCEVTTQTYPLTVLSGANCPNECDYSLNLTDSFGDGWDGASIEVFQDGTSLGTYTVAVSADNFVLTLTDGAAIDIVYTAGAFENEHTYEIIDPFGNSIFSDGPSPGAGTSFTAGCSMPTCEDGIQNGDETGVDCGGSLCGDCCGNGVQDADETGVDCGGLTCAPCPACAADFTEVLNETFDGCAQPAGWTVSSTGTGTIANGDFSFSGAPDGVPSGAAGPPADFSGCIAFIDDDNDQGNIGIHCIVTPVIDITAYINASLTYDWQHENLGGSTFNVEVYDGTNWVNVFTSLADENGNNETTNLDAYANAAFQVRFCYDDAGGWAWGAGIDNVSICGQPNDMCPTEITTNDVSGDYCDGTTAVVTANSNPNVTYAWSSDNANIQVVDATAASTSVEFSALTACAIETANISLVATCIIDDVELFNGVVSTVNVYPAAPADLTTLVTITDGTCMEPVMVLAGCEDFVNLVADVANPSFPVNPGDMGTANYTIEYTQPAGAPACCTDPVAGEVVIGGADATGNIDGDLEIIGTGGASQWTGTSTNFGSPLCDNGSCGTGLGSVNYGVAPNSGSWLAWFGGAGGPLETGTLETTVTIPVCSDGVAEMTFGYENSVCGSAADFIELSVDGAVLWSDDGDPATCDVAGTVTLVTVDLSAYADGAAHTILFTSTSGVDGVSSSNFTVDNIMLATVGCATVSICSAPVSGDYACEGCTITASEISTLDPTRICIDGVADPINVSVDVEGGGTGVWVITDASATVLALPGGPPFDLDGAGAGQCLIWYANIDDDAFVLNEGDDAAAAIAASSCAFLSNPITVDRIEVTSPVISTTSNTDICTGDGAPDMIDVTVDDAGIGANSAWVITDANGIVLALPPTGPPFDLEGAGAGTCLIWLANIEDPNFAIAEGDDAAALIAGATCAALSNPITVTRAADCAPMISISDPCNCENGLDLNNDGINDILNETVSIMPGTAPYTITAYSDLSTTGLVDMAGNPLDQAALQALLDAAVPDADGNVSIGVYIPADGASVFSITVADSNGATASFTKTAPCTSCAPVEQVPTVGEWGLIILGLMMSIVAIVGIRERRKVYA